MTYAKNARQLPFNLPSLEGVGEVVISKQVVDGTAPPLYIYADHTGGASP